ARVATENQSRCDVRLLGTAGPLTRGLGKAGVNAIGIMQGRLSPPENDRIQAFPTEHWMQEFPAAQSAALDCIEWIVDERGPNPILTDEGIDSIRRLAEHHDVAVRSVCADILMEHPVLRVSAERRQAATAAFQALVCTLGRAGVQRVIMPFVDRSAITSAGEQNEVVKFVEATLVATPSTVELHLELALCPVEVASLLRRLPDPRVKVNYDSGNSASLGYDPREEFGEYGHRIGSVHIKDRRRGGGTVPLGEGAADLPLVFSLLRQFNYSGDVI